MRTIDEVCETYRNKRVAQFQEAAESVIGLAEVGLSVAETAELARAVAASGHILRLPNYLAPFADVPSTGAPGSLSTVLCPFLIAAAGVSVPKISATGSIAGAID